MDLHVTCEAGPAEGFLCTDLRNKDRESTMEINYGSELIPFVELISVERSIRGSGPVLGTPSN